MLYSKQGLLVLAGGNGNRLMVADGRVGQMNDYHLKVDWTWQRNQQRTTGGVFISADNVESALNKVRHYWPDYDILLIEAVKLNKD